MILMTKKTIMPLRGLSIQELEEKIAELRAQLAKEISVKSSGTRPEKPATIRKLKRQVARCLTMISEKQKPKQKEAN